MGFKPTESTVTVMTAGSYSASLSGLIAFGGGAVFPWTPENLLDNMVKTIELDRSVMTIWKLGTAVPSPPKHFLVLHPEFAMELNRLGFDRKKVQGYLYEKTSIPFEQLTRKEVQSLQRRIDAGDIPADRVNVFKGALKPGGKVPPF